MLGISAPGRKRARRRGSSPVARGRVVGGSRAVPLRRRGVAQPPKMGIPPIPQARHVQPRAPIESRVPVAGPALGPPPLTGEGQQLRNNAGAAWGTAQNTYRDSVFQAAMALGDPNAWAKLQADPQFAGYTFAADPNSDYSRLAREETEGLTDVNQARNANNTFFSGFRLKDRSNLSDDIQRQRLASTSSYDTALREYAAALAGSRDQYNQALWDADQYDLKQAQAAEPEPGPTDDEEDESPHAPYHQPKKKRPRRRRRHH